MLLECVVEQKECVISSTQLLEKSGWKKNKNEISTGYISRRKIENNKKKKEIFFSSVKENKKNSDWKELCVKNRVYFWRWCEN